MQAPAQRPPARLQLDTPLQFVRGVGAARAKQFEGARLNTVGDLLFYFPYRYEDRRKPTFIRDLRTVGVPVTLRGRIVSAGLKISPVRRLRIFEAILDDGTGTIMLVWFNQPWMQEKLRRGDHISIWGQPHINTRSRLQIENPDWEKLEPEGEGEEEGSIVPVYSAVAGVPPKVVRKIAAAALEAVIDLRDPLPPELRKRLDVIPLEHAVVQLHRPTELDQEFLNFRSPAHRRVILQEFFAFQLALRIRRAMSESRKKKTPLRIDDGIRAQVRRILPFKLTGAQKRVLKEIADDFRSEKPMYRLLQGDVGSGKTIVALIASIIAIANNLQAALLAPTEILAEQHDQRIRQLVGSSIRVAKLTGSTKGAERKAILNDLRAGRIDLIIGTHALLEDPVRFRAMGVAIVDEQHRFGVLQRQRLFEKAEIPDVLIMTATPIPRSMAIATHGDLDLSVIDELPPGRQPIKTVVRGTTQARRVYDFIEKELASGAQAYIVYPIIEESDKLDLKPLSAGVETIRAAFPKRRVAMLHGRMPAEEKDAVMQRFKKGEIDLLVSTTVIEVGIDVPNASIMLIMDADRFGLSQLHQLRGRVGRGERKSYCVLLRDETISEDAKERLRVFEKTRDGFEVSERDLEIRGPGDFFGTRQAGLPKFAFGNILRDRELMEQARKAAIEVVEGGKFGKAEEILKALAGDQHAIAVGRD